MALKNDRERAIANLQQLIRIPTISRLDEAETDWAAFKRFRREFASLYPLIHEKLTLEPVDTHSMLFKWEGQEPGDPAVLMAHYDVVAATDEGWEHPPFAAEIVTEPDGSQTLWGRGTLDDKGSLVCAAEAVEAALREGFQPRHDVYLSFGHNEEVAGTGAMRAVDLFQTRKIRPRLVLDEGGAVVEGIFPGVTKPIAVVGVSEKGIMSLRLSVNQPGGHASAPPREAATIRLARALVRLNKKPFRKSFVPTNLEMIRTVGNHARQPLKWVFTNQWLTRRPLLWLFGRLTDETRAMVRTTQVASQLRGAQAANAIPETAEAIVNIRIAIDSSTAQAIDHVRKAIRDPGVQIEAIHPTEPSPASPTSGPAWELVKAAISETYRDAIVTPYVMLGASDSRHFARVSDFVYRFSPFEMSTEERGTLHAMNERIRVETFLRGIEFYRKVIAAL